MILRRDAVKVRVRRQMTRLARHLLFIFCILLPFGAQSGQAESCLAAASQHHKVNYLLLLAIAKVESGMRADAVAMNKNHTTDRGLMQINDWWLPTLAKHGISTSDLMKPCVSAYVGAWILSMEIAKYGSTWKAVGAYNSRDPAKQAVYVKKVYVMFSKVLRGAG